MLHFFSIFSRTAFQLQKDHFLPLPYSSTLFTIQFMISRVHYYVFILVEPSSYQTSISPCSSLSFNISISFTRFTYQFQELSYQITSKEIHLTIVYGHPFSFDHCRKILYQFYRSTQNRKFNLRIAPVCLPNDTLVSDYP